MGRAREKLLQEMRRAAARGHAGSFERGTVKFGRQQKAAVRAKCRCGWSSRWRHNQTQALAALTFHVGQVGGEDPLWDPVLGDPGDSAGADHDTPNRVKVLHRDASGL